MGPPTLRIRLLGGLDLRLGTESLALDSTRIESLLAYLLLHREAPQPRQHLAFLLWPDSTEAQAQTNLRHVLHRLRRALPELDRFLEVTPRTLQWQSDAPIWLDIAAFEESLVRAERETGDGSLAALKEATELYRGDLLEGAYDEWALEARERLRQRYLTVLERLATLLEARGEYTEAIQYAERLLNQDPLDEAMYRLLMRLHNARGERARALRAYHVCAAALERELGVEPSAATREAYEALLPLESHPVSAEVRAGPVGGPPFVGRVPERSRLMTLWRVSERGRAQLVLVTGEAGIGKTRLVEELRSWCAHRGVVTAVARSYAAEGTLAYGPVATWLRSGPLKALAERLDRGQLAELARLLPELLAKAPEMAYPEPMDESDRRQRLFDAVVRALLPSDGPLLLVADDLHWWDRESLQLLHYLLRVEPEARLLVAATARREELDPQHPLNELLLGLQALECFTEIEVERLNREETAVLAEQLAGLRIEEQDADRLYGETEGNPLFVVETLRAGWESNRQGREQMSSRVQSVIGYRLAQLSEQARNLAGIAATIGREFTSDVLTHASEADEAMLVRGLDELWRRRIIREQGVDAYDFTHDKIRELAYLALSPAQRRHHHLHVAHALELLNAYNLGAVSGQIAAHHERAGAPDQAVMWYERAAEAAQHLYASVEAVRLLYRALDLVDAPPVSPQRDAQELAILTALPGPLVAIEGYRSRRLSEVQQRALELAHGLGIEPAPPLLRSLAVASLSQSDFERAQRFGEQLRARGERDADEVLLVESEYVLGIAAFWQGNLAAARRHFEVAVDLYRPEHRRAHLLQYGQDPKVLCLMRLGITLWFLGDPEAATRARDVALALADEIGHPYSRKTALFFAAILSLEMRDLERLREYTARLHAEHTGREPQQTQLGVDVLEGYIDVLDGRLEAGIVRMQRAREEADVAEPAPGIQAILVRVLLEACAAAGEARSGLAAADQALAMGGAARLWEAETRRLRAEFLAALGGSPGDVDAELERARQVARRQGAKLLELRVTASLLRHRLSRGDGPGATEARQLLIAIAEAIPEGQNIPDLGEFATILAQS